MTFLPRHSLLSRVGPEAHERAHSRGSALDETGRTTRLLSAKHFSEQHPSPGRQGGQMGCTPTRGRGETCRRRLTAALLPAAGVLTSGCDAGTSAPTPPGSPGHHAPERGRGATLIWAAESGIGLLGPQATLTLASREAHLVALNAGPDRTHPGYMDTERPEDRCFYIDGEGLAPVRGTEHSRIQTISESRRIQRCRGAFSRTGWRDTRTGRVQFGWNGFPHYVRSHREARAHNGRNRHDIHYRKLECRLPKWLIPGSTDDRPGTLQGAMS